MKLIDRDKIREKAGRRKYQVMSAEDREALRKRAQNTPYLDKLLALPDKDK